MEAGGTTHRYNEKAPMQTDCMGATSVPDREPTISERTATRA